MKILNYKYFNFYVISFFAAIVITLIGIFGIHERAQNDYFAKKELAASYSGVVIRMNLIVRNPQIFIKTFDNREINIDASDPCFYENAEVGDTIEKLKNLIFIKKKFTSDTID